MLSKFFRCFIVSICLLNVYISSAQVCQVGKVVELNSNGRAVSGVSVEAVLSDDVQPAVSDDNGVFVLNFSKKKNGDIAYNLRVHKLGYEVVNNQIIKNGIILTDRDTLKIVLAQPAKLAEARASYYEIFDNYHVNIYKKQAEDLRNQLKTNELTLSDYKERIAKAEQELKDVNAKVEQFADKFSRINKDDMDSVSLLAFAALDNGDVEGALRVYSDFNSYQRLSQKIQQRDDANASIKALIPGMLDEIEIRLVVGGNENHRIIGEMYDKIIEADSLGNGLIIHNAIHFFSDELNVEKVMKYGKMFERNYESKIIMPYIYMYMGRMAWRSNDFENAHLYYGRAIAAADESRNFGVDNMSFDMMINYPMHELGIMYYQNYEYEKSEQTLRKALKIRKRMSETDHKFDGEYANTLSCLAVIFSDQAKYDSALICINEAIRIETAAFPEGQHKFNPMFAHFHAIKGNIYLSMNDLQNAKISLVEALSIYEDNEVRNFNVNSYLTTLQKLAKTEYLLDETGAASRDYEKLIDLCKKYGEGNEYYDENYGMANEHYGDVFLQNKDFAKAIEYYDFARIIYEKSSDRLRASRHHLITCYTRLGRAYSELDENKQAEEAFLKSYSIIKEFYDEDEDTNRALYESTCGFVSGFYKKIGKKREARKYERCLS